MTREMLLHYREHKEVARRVIHERLSHWGGILNIPYGRVAIRNQRSRWGSCSSRGNLNFNYRLVLLPPELIDYVIVHELCHLLEFNHSRAFWAHVANALPDFHIRRRALRLLPVQSVHKGPHMPQKRITEV